MVSPFLAALALREGQGHTVWTYSYYVHPVNPQEWIVRCSARLHQRWPRLTEDELREVAAEIQREVQRQVDEPELAAAVWLRQGMPEAK